jgi:hypothetical protein
MNAAPHRVAVRAAGPEAADRVAALFNAINSLGGAPPPVTMTDAAA